MSLTELLHCSTRRQDQADSLDTPTATPVTPSSTATLPTAHGTAITGSDAETSDEPDAAYHGADNREDDAPETATRQEPGDWGYGLSASRTRATAELRQTRPTNESPSEPVVTPRPNDQQQSRLSLQPAATGPAANRARSTTRPTTTTRSSTGWESHSAGPQAPASRHTTPRPATPPPAIDVEVQAYLNQPVDAPDSPPPSPDTPPPTHMDASDIRDPEENGVLDHGYLPTPAAPLTESPTLMEINAHT